MGTEWPRRDDKKMEAVLLGLHVCMCWTESQWGLCKMRWTRKDTEGAGYAPQLEGIVCNMSLLGIARVYVAPRRIP